MCEGVNSDLPLKATMLSVDKVAIISESLENSIGVHHLALDKVFVL